MGRTGRRHRAARAHLGLRRQHRARGDEVRRVGRSRVARHQRHRPRRLREQLRRDGARGRPRARRPALGSAARHLGDPRRPFPLGGDGRLRADRGERAPRVEGPERARRGRVRADQDRRLGRLRRGEDPVLRGARRARRLVRSRLGSHPRSERLHRRRRPHGRPPVREGRASLQAERAARNRAFKVLHPHGR